MRLDEVLGVPESWREYLQATKGIYLLVDIDDGKQYVGSAKGEESLWNRFRAYATDGHGGNIALKERGPRLYQASILQVVDTGMPDEGIERLEQHWKKKLMSEEPFGLNRN